MSVSLAEVMAAARTHVAPLAGESAGYLVLATADQMLGAPRAISPQGIRLAEDGTVRIVDGGAITSDAAERSLRELLESLLLCASSTTSALLRAARRGPGSGLEGLVREIEAALIPVNRSAAKRALSRLSRETLRAKERGVLDSVAPEPAVAPKTVAAPALTRAAPPAPPPNPEPEPELDLEVDVVLEDDSYEATRAVALPLPTDPPADAEPEPQTRPEPAVLRASLRPPGAPIDVQPLRTPRIGSFLTDPAPVVVPSPPPVEAAVGETDCTDPMPEMLEQSPPLAETFEPCAPQRSDVNVLLANFAVTEQQPDGDLRRTLKEIAGVDLTPGNVPAETR